MVEITFPHFSQTCQNTRWKFIFRGFWLQCIPNNSLVDNSCSFENKFFFPFLLVIIVFSLAVPNKILVLNFQIGIQELIILFSINVKKVFICLKPLVQLWTNKMANNQQKGWTTLEQLFYFNLTYIKVVNFCMPLFC